MARLRNYQIDKVWEHRQGPAISLKSDQYSETFLELLKNRGYDTEEKISQYLNPDYSLLSDPFKLPNVSDAVQIILDAIANQSKIVIYGDYDVDGITSTALLHRFFRSLGVTVDTYIPSRHTEGYGLNEEAIRQIAARGTDLVITVDCGAASKKECDLAKDLGLKMVVTDHHAIKDKDLLPDSCPVINPQVIQGDSPLKSLAGVGVAFYLVRAIIKTSPSLIPQGQEKWLLDLVAFGTVCDIVSLTKDNRILVFWGLTVLSKTQNVGIKKLAEIMALNLKQVSSYDIGFGFGPRLNAAGRLEHAQNALDLLITEDAQEAKKIADELNLLNKDRQELTERVILEAKQMIAEKGEESPILLLSSKEWPAGIVGIVASRLVEDCGRPALVMEDMGDHLKGSARSVEGFNIIEALRECSECFSQFGGHDYAAGFTLPKKNFELLNKKLTQIAKKHFSSNKITPKVNVDLNLSLSQINRKFLDEIESMAPYGKDNPKPVLSVSAIQLTEARLVGNPNIHLKLKVSDSNISLSGIAFGWGETMALKMDKSYDLALNLELNSFNGRENVEFRLVDIRESQNK